MPCNGSDVIESMLGATTKRRRDGYIVVMDDAGDDLTDHERPVDQPLHQLPGTKVTVYPDGPLVVRGDFVVEDVDGRLLVRERSVALCRCGRSARKPLCDGSHRNAGRRRSTS